MTHLFFGENVFEIERQLKKLLDNFDGEIEKIDATTLNPEQLSDLLAGTTLFGESRLIVIKGASENKPVWTALGEWLQRGIENDLVLVESGVDKRTKTYKLLQKSAVVSECAPWREYELGKAKDWLQKYLKEHGISAQSGLVERMIRRAITLSEGDKPIIDQQLLAHTVEVLQHVDGVVDENIIDAVLPPSTYENVFDLFSVALRGETREIIKTMGRLKKTQDGYKTAGLICSQAVNLGVLSEAYRSNITSSQAAKDTGAHPFALSQLESSARSKTPQEITQIIEIVVQMDEAIKTSRLEPWVAIEVALVRLTKIKEARV